MTPQGALRLSRFLRGVGFGPPKTTKYLVDEGWRYRAWWHADRHLLVVYGWDDDLDWFASICGVVQSDTSPDGGDWDPDTISSIANISSGDDDPVTDVERAIRSVLSWTVTTPWEDDTGIEDGEFVMTELAAMVAFSHETKVTPTKVDDWPGDSYVIKPRSSYSLMKVVGHIANDDDEVDVAEVRALDPEELGPVFRLKRHHLVPA